MQMKIVENVRHERPPFELVLPISWQLPKEKQKKLHIKLQDRVSNETFDGCMIAVCSICPSVPFLSNAVSSGTAIFIFFLMLGLALQRKDCV